MYIAVHSQWHIEKRFEASLSILHFTSAFDFVIRYCLYFSLRLVQMVLDKRPNKRYCVPNTAK